MVKKNKTLQKVLVVIGLGVISLLMVYPFLRLHQIAVCSDWAFHASRAEQIYDNLKEGHVLTYIATSTFGGVGTGSFLFYPTVFLYPWVIFRFFVSPIMAYMLFLIFIFWLTLSISYFSMYSLSKSRLRSYLFALIYSIAPYHLYLGITNNVLGEFIAYSFLPLVFLAIYNILYLNKSSWKLLGIGMALLLYSHLVSVMITIEFLMLILIMYLIFHGKLSGKQLKNLMRAICLTILLSMFVVVPFITDYIGKNITAPASGILILFDTSQMFMQSLANKATNTGGLGIILLATVIFGWSWTRNDKRDRYIYYYGLFATIIITSLIPWYLFTKTPLALIQFPYRYFSYAILFLSVVVSRFFEKLLSKFTIKYLDFTSLNFVKGIVITIFAMIIYAGSVSDDITRNANTNHDEYLTTLKRGMLVNSYSATKTTTLNNKNWKYQFDYMVLYGEMDYYPSITRNSWESLLKHKAYVNGKERIIIPKPSANELTYQIKTRKKSVVDLPVIAYSNTIVSADGSPMIKHVSNRGTVTVILKKAGMHTVKIGYKPSNLLIIAICMAVVTWMALLVNWLIKLFNKF